MNWDSLSDRLKQTEASIGTLWLWGLTLVVAAFLTLILAELHALGVFADDESQRLAHVLWALVLVGLLGIALHLSHAVVDLSAYFQARDGS